MAAAGSSIRVAVRHPERASFLENLGPAGQIDVFFYFLTALSIAWASVWLLVPWLRADSSMVRALLGCVVMLVVGIVAHLSYYASGLSVDTAACWMC